MAYQPHTPESLEVRRQECSEKGHEGCCLPWRPSGWTNQQLFEHGRCCRCGELRWPPPADD
jgi:hypothetical protein